MIEDIIIVWFLTMGIFSLSQEQMPFEFFQKITNDEKLNSRSILFDPLTNCLCCMASFWTCVYFGCLYGMPLNILVIYLGLFAFILIFSVLLGRGEDVDLLGKILYYFLVISFFLLLPTKNIEAVICMVSVVGINYHIVKFSDKGL